MTAYGLRISDWSSDVCSSDLPPRLQHPLGAAFRPERKLADGGDQIGADRHRHFGGGGGRGRADIGGEIAQCRVSLVPHRRDGRNAAFGDRPHAEFLVEGRSEERRVGKEWVRSGRARWSEDY